MALRRPVISGFWGTEANITSMLRIDDIASDWVFAYGSLIWAPGIEFAERRVARLYGYHRAFCISSTRYRGTTERPGAVLGLDRGGSCTGVAYRLKTASRQASLKALFQREIPDPARAVYKASMVQLVLGDPCPIGAPCPAMTDLGTQAQGAPRLRRVDEHGPRVHALTFLADRALPAYVRLDMDQLIARLNGCDGERGRNLDYALNTWQSLRDMGFEDRRLRRIVARLQASMPA